MKVTHSESVRYGRIALFVLGWAIFRGAPFLSEQVVFYYLSGVSLGVSLSVLLIAFFVFKRVMPKRSSIFSLMFAALAQSLFGFLSVLTGWWEQLISEHIEVVVVYVLVAAGLSLALTHWLLKGPSGVEVGTGMRDIVRIAIRGIGCFCIYMSTRSLFWSILFLVGLACWALLGGPFKGFGGVVYDKLFPDYGIAVMNENYLGDHKFLSPSEYEVQGKIETEKHMSMLLQSPHFQKWAIKNANRIKVSSHQD